MENWFSRGLAGWYKLNKRDLPWRAEKDPYKIWLSEVILQQTQVAQGLSYYLKFVKKYPTVKHLARAPEDEVLKLWQGLGYYSRARNLHAAAKHISRAHKGSFPTTYQTIKELKGVGDYTAAAIASFAFGLPQAVVDGNVYRVLSRLFGIETAIDSGVAKKQFQELAQELLDKKEPGRHNQAIMEFGSQYCKPVNPSCDECIFNSKCFAFKTLKVAELPYKAKKTKIRSRYFNYFVVIDQGNHVFVRKRSENDIWKGLYEFVLIETEKETDARELILLPAARRLFGRKVVIERVSQRYKHILSHQHLYTRFIVLRVPSFAGSNFKKVSPGGLQALAFPRLIENFLNDGDLKEII